MRRSSASGSRWVGRIPVLMFVLFAGYWSIVDIHMGLYGLILPSAVVGVLLAGSKLGRREPG